MFAHDLRHSQIEYLRKFIAFIRNDGAKRLPQIFNSQYSIVNFGFAGLGTSDPQEPYLLSQGPDRRHVLRETPHKDIIMIGIGDLQQGFI